MQIRNFILLKGEGIGNREMVQSNKSEKLLRWMVHQLPCVSLLAAFITPALKILSMPFNQ